MIKTKQSSDYINFNNEIQSKIENEVKDFRDKIFNDYKIKIYITIPSINRNKPPIASMHDFWHIVTEIIQKDNPELYQYIDFKKKTRSKEWMFYVHSFAFLANKKLDFGPTEISRFMNKNHATIINSINKTENAIWANDDYFLFVYNKMHEKLKEYVGIISKNTKV